MRRNFGQGRFTADFPIAVIRMMSLKVGPLRLKGTHGAITLVYLELMRVPADRLFEPYHLCRPVQNDEKLVVGRIAGGMPSNDGPT